MRTSSSISNDLIEQSLHGTGVDDTEEELHVVNNLFKASLNVEADDSSSSPRCVGSKLSIALTLLNNQPTFDIATGDNQQEGEKALIQAIRSIMGAFNCSYPAQNGLILPSTNMQTVITSLQTSSTIDYVPIDPRRECCELVDYCIGAMEIGLSTILCCGDVPQSGKTVLQGINMIKFGELTNGIAIDISFTGDKVLWVNPEYNTPLHYWKWCFRTVVGLKLLSRVFEYCYNQPLDTQSEEIMEYILFLQDPLSSILNIIPTLLNAPYQDNVKILLCIDDIDIAFVQDDEINMYQLLDSLCSNAVVQQELDDENEIATTATRKPQLHISLVFKGLFELMTFKGYSESGLEIQSLSPMRLNCNDIDKIEVLPPILHLFYDIGKRFHPLPASEENLSIYNTIVALVTATGGHAGRLSILLQYLHRCPVDIPQIDHDVQCSIFAIGEWLQLSQHEVRVAMDQCFQFPDKESLPWLSDVTGLSISDVVEILANKSTAHMNIQYTDYDHPTILPLLHCANMGFCSIQIALQDLSPYYLACIPFWVLQSLPCVEHLQPCGQALFQLRDALQDCYTMTGRPLSRFQIGKVVCAAFLLYVRSVAWFSPIVFCEYDYKGDGSLSGALLSGSHVAYLDNIDFCPLDVDSNKTKKNLQSLLDILWNFSCDDAGLVFIPPCQSPFYSTVMGLFTAARDFHYVLLYLQILDGNNPLSVDAGRQNRESYQKSFYCEDHIADHILVEIKFIIIVMNVEDVERGYSSGESWATLRSMVNWAPTAAYGLEQALCISI